IDEEATFMTEFKETWQTFMSDCFLKMVEETLNEKKAFEYTVGEFVEFIYTNNKNQHERQFRRIEAIISFLVPSSSDYPNNQMHDTLKMSRFLRHDKLGVYYSQNKSRRGHKELWNIEEDYQIISSNYILEHTSIWLENVSQPDYYDFHVSKILYRDTITRRIQI
ncbi:16088_t:CDS:2, partial [Cetraspora pellucida]